MFQKVFPVLLVVSAVAVPLLVAMNLNEGHFVYTLDDPYIHLALADNIAEGHYGINPEEVTAPSSSVLWPFLLAPFAWVQVFQGIPFVLNLFFASVSAVLLFRFFHWENALFSAVSVFAFNLPGLVLTGMEHSLQLLLAVVIAAGASKYADTGKISRPMLAALLFAPLVRYESLAVSLPVLVFLYVTGEKKSSMTIAMILVFCLGGFSLFLVSLGLFPLPASVFAKSSVVAERSILSNVVLSIGSFRGIMQALLLIPLGFCVTSGGRSNRERLLAASCLLGIIMHIAVGRFGWFHRYGVYIWVYSVMICFHLYRPVIERRVILFTTILLLSSANYLTGYYRIPGASSNIYRQQYQMMRFAGGWLDEPVAVNDLGLVALHSSHYILDMWGLATPEALEGASNPAWVDSAASARRVNLAIVYMEELPGIQHWHRIARMELHPPLVVCPSGGVDFLVAPWADQGYYSLLVRSFAVTLPDGIDLIQYE